MINFNKELMDFKRKNKFTILGLWEYFKKQGMPVSIGTVRIWLYPNSGRSKFPNYSHMIKISKIINVPIDKLYGNCDDNTVDTPLAEAGYKS